MWLMIMAIVEISLALVLLVDIILIFYENFHKKETNIKKEIIISHQVIKGLMLFGPILMIIINLIIVDIFFVFIWIIMLVLTSCSVIVRSKTFKKK